MWKDTEQGKKYYREYYKKNKGRIEKRKKEYREENIDLYRKIGRDYYWRHKDKIRERMKKRYPTPKYRFFALKASAKHRGLLVEITFDDFIKITKGLCEYCGEKNNGFGVDRLDSSIGYLKENCVSCCSTCNFMKLSLTKDQFLEHIEKIYKHNQ